MAADVILSALILAAGAGVMLLNRRSERRRRQRRADFHQRIEDERHADEVMDKVLAQSKHFRYCEGWAQAMFARGDYSSAARYAQAAVPAAQEIGDAEGAARNARLAIEAQGAALRRRRAEFGEDSDFWLRHARGEEDRRVNAYMAASALKAAREARDAQRCRAAQRLVKEIDGS